MKLGKISEMVLKRSVFKQLSTRRKEVMIGPNIGEDCAVITFEQDEVCVVSTDPITGAAKDIGFLAVHITANDLASSGAEPIGILLTVLLPEGYRENELRLMMQDINKACEELNIQVVGGHTEITDAVNKPIISVTGIGKVHKDKLVLTKKAEVGQAIILTKWAGIEGTAILSKDHEKELKAHFNTELVDEAMKLSDYISVVEEGKIAALHGATSMHDVTEGGVYGALWEMASCSKVGIEVELDKIPIKQETIEICEFYELNPYKLISSGCMLITTYQGEELIHKLVSRGIKATIIGKITEGTKRVIIGSNIQQSLEPPKSDEIFKVKA